MMRALAPHDDGRNARKHERVVVYEDQPAPTRVRSPTNTQRQHHPRLLKAQELGREVGHLSTLEE